MLVKSYKKKKDYRINIMIDLQYNWNQSVLDNVFQLSVYLDSTNAKKMEKGNLIVCKERKIINMKSINRSRLIINKK